MTLPSVFPLVRAPVPSPRVRGAHVTSQRRSHALASAFVFFYATIRVGKLNGNVSISGGILLYSNRLKTAVFFCIATIASPSALARLTFPEPLTKITLSTAFRRTVVHHRSVKRVGKCSDDSPTGVGIFLMIV